MTNLTPTTSGTDRYGHQGLLQDTTGVVWACPHAHPTSTRLSDQDGTSALHCARFMLQLVEQPDTAAQVRATSAAGFGGGHADPEAARRLRLQYAQLCSLEPHAQALRDQLAAAAAAAAAQPPATTEG